MGFYGPAWLMRLCCGLQDKLPGGNEEGVAKERAWSLAADGLGAEDVLTTMYLGGRYPIGSRRR